MTGCKEKIKKAQYRLTLKVHNTGVHSDYRLVIGPCTCNTGVHCDYRYVIGPCTCKLH